MSTRADPAFATRFLRERFGDEAGSPAELLGGEWSRAYAYTYRGERWVVRFSQYREDMAKDRLVGRYACAAVPVPAVVEMQAIGDLWYTITPLVEGRFLEELDGPGFGRALPAVLGMIEAMRDADTAQFAGSGPWEPDGRGFYDSWRAFLLDVGRDDPGGRTHGWRRALADDPAAGSTFERGLATLLSAVESCPEHRHLVHNDLLHRNVFVDPGGRIAGVIDWGNALYGDCLYDLALLVFWSPWFPAIDERVVVEEGMSRFGASGNHFHERLFAYQLRVGLEHIAYNAFLGPERSGEMERVCRRTLEVISSGGAG